MFIQNLLIFNDDKISILDVPLRDTSNEDIINEIEL